MTLLTYQVTTIYVPDLRLRGEGRTRGSAIENNKVIRQWHML